MARTSHDDPVPVGEWSFFAFLSTLWRRPRRIGPVARLDGNQNDASRSV